MVADGRVFAGDTAGTVFALDAVTGHLLWRTTGLGGPINSSAAFDAGRVFFAVARAGSPFLAAFNARTGHRLWTTVLTRQDGSDVFGSPVPFRGSVLIGTSGLFGETRETAPTTRGSVLRVNAESGAIFWQTFTVTRSSTSSGTGGGVWSTAAVDPMSGRVFVGTGNAYQPPADPHTDSILALDFASGAVVASFQATPNDVWTALGKPTGQDFDLGASPNLFTLADGTKLVGEGQKSGVYWAFRRDTLMPVWSTRVSPGSSVGGVLGSTATDGMSVFGPATLPGEVWSLKMAGGGIRWLEPSPDIIKWGPVSQSNGILYAASSAGLLQTWDAATGLPLLSLPLGRPSFGGVSIAGGRIFATTGTSFDTDGSIQAFGSG